MSACTTPVTHEFTDYGEARRLVNAAVTADVPVSDIRQTRTGWVVVTAGPVASRIPGPVRAT